MWFLMTFHILFFSVAFLSGSLYYKFIAGEK
jgi:hypothetical protein